MDAVANDGPLPVETVRDLLGVTRALYAAIQAMGPGYSDQLFRLRGIGFQLNLALEKAEKGGPGTLHHRSAWLIAEKAVEDLGVLVDGSLPARMLVISAGERVLKRQR